MEALAQLRRLEHAYPRTGFMLQASSPLQVLVATMLSAQATDQQVNKALPALFRRYPAVQDFAAADLRELERQIKSIGLYRSKARNVRQACRLILQRSAGAVPGTMAGLLQLPGVGRKTANVVLHQAFGKAEGIAVDTHVARLAGRLGWSKQQDRGKIEQDLMALLPRPSWGKLTFLLISHGRQVCQARRPACSRCLLEKACPKAGVQGSK